MIQDPTVNSASTYDFHSHQQANKIVMDILQLNTLLQTHNYSSDLLAIMII